MVATIQEVAKLCRNTEFMPGARRPANYPEEYVGWCLGIFCMWNCCLCARVEGVSLGLYVCLGTCVRDATCFLGSGATSAVNRPSPVGANACSLCPCYHSPACHSFAPPRQLLCEVSHPRGYRPEDRGPAAVRRCVRPDKVGDHWSRVTVTQRDFGGWTMEWRGVCVCGQWCE